MTDDKAIISESPEAGGGAAVKWANVADWFEAQLHSNFTVMADQLFGDGKLTREERIALSNAIGEALDAFHARLQQPDLAGLYARRPFVDDAPMLAKAGRRNSAADQARVQAVHDMAVALGAACGEATSTSSVSAEPASSGEPASDEADDDEAMKRQVDENVGGGVDRDKLEDDDFVIPESRNFPVVTPADVSDAVAAWGRYKGDVTFETFKRRLIDLCRRKGKAFVAALPAEWQEEMDAGASKRVQLNTLKALGQQRIGGYAVLWGDPDHRDVTNEYFTPETEELDVIFQRMKALPSLYDHASDGAMKSAVVAKVDLMEPDDVGMWFEAQLLQSDKYRAAILQLIERGALGVSTGTLPWARKVAKDGRILRWPIAEISLTPTPAEYRMMERPVSEIKAAWTAIGLELGVDATPADTGHQSTAVALELERLALLQLQL